ncbi:hypothetical protein A3I40_02285 [Candidatus Uhrbacteria bacterium RIFCSPLOWO2_02_FULL_48_12]|uniref:Core-binding (CB) domain-containing protein n=1 Tax=Candidatus Uhrbacteria bacterium RIFCSPLOWO2_02_FULL_48_12 TaxID=1802407 RepID=A0A1F7VAX3_9BACT|nr:MAG: hypothetical protein A3I40_02285 [Candidatus Uhrbacteria bacterium RIFCSPLOWO2_02_FULL_48_12]
MEEYVRKTEEELRLRNYSPKTRISYLRCLREYFIYKQGNLDTLDIQSIKTFLLGKQDKGAAPQTIKH